MKVQTKRATNIINNLKKETAHVEKMRSKIETKSKQMTALKKAGLKYGKLNCNGKKYHWFIGKMIKGKRVREYVGNNKKKLKQYQDAIDRAVKYEQLKNEIKDINQYLYDDYRRFL